MKNYNVAVREWHDQIVFLRKIVDGGTDKSYGIHVARLAGLPKEVIERAKEILANLEEAELSAEGKPKLAERKRKAESGKRGAKDSSAKDGVKEPPQMYLFGEKKIRRKTDCIGATACCNTLKPVTIRKYFEFVRFEHTVFALPFALAAMAVAARETHGWPGWRTFLLILAAMVCARTAAMGFNRIVDRKFDALNPRTAGRHLPTGQMSVIGAWWLVIGAAAGLVAVSWFINRICFYLSPVALAIVFFYSFTKRFTDFSHFFLGLALGVAPVGAWLAVRGRI